MILRYFYECEICNHYHPCQFIGDCRDEESSFTDDSIQELYSDDEIIIVSMEEADVHPPTEDEDDE